MNIEDLNVDDFHLEGWPAAANLLRRSAESGDARYASLSALVGRSSVQLGRFLFQDEDEDEPEPLEYPPSYDEDEDDTPNMGGAVEAAEWAVRLAMHHALRGPAKLRLRVYGNASRNFGSATFSCADKRHAARGASTAGASTGSAEQGAGVDGAAASAVEQVMQRAVVAGVDVTPPPDIPMPNVGFTSRRFTGPADSGQWGLAQLAPAFSEAMQTLLATFKTTTQIQLSLTQHMMRMQAAQSGQLHAHLQSARQHEAQTRSQMFDALLEQRRVDADTTVAQEESESDRARMALAEQAMGQIGALTQVLMMTKGGMPPELMALAENPQVMQLAGVMKDAPQLAGVFGALLSNEQLAGVLMDPRLGQVVSDPENLGLLALLLGQAVEEVGGDPSAAQTPQATQATPGDGAGIEPQPGPVGDAPLDPGAVPPPVEVAQPIPPAEVVPPPLHPSPAMHAPPTYAAPPAPQAQAPQAWQPRRLRRSRGA